MNFEESAKSRGLRGNMGHVGAWLRGLRGSNFYAGCVGYAGQNIFYVGHNFCVGCLGQICFCVGLCVDQNFLRGSFFPVRQLLLNRSDYFTILIVWAFFSGVLSQQILKKPCFTPLVFLSGLLEICKIDDIQ